MKITKQTIEQIRRGLSHSYGTTMVMNYNLLQLCDLSLKAMAHAEIENPATELQVESREDRERKRWDDLHPGGGLCNNEYCRCQS